MWQQTFFPSRKTDHVTVSFIKYITVFIRHLNDTLVNNVCMSFHVAYELSITRVFLEMTKTHTWQLDHFRYLSQSTVEFNNKHLLFITKLKCWYNLSCAISINICYFSDLHFLQIGTTCFSRFKVSRYSLSFDWV